MKAFTMQKIVILLSLILVSFQNTNLFANDFVEKIENAHQKEKFLSNKVVQFDFYLEFGGKKRMNSKITLKTDSGKGILEMENGTKIQFFNDEVYCSPEIENTKRVRFNAYTWSYFFLFPYKLSDSGTKWSEFEAIESDSKKYNSKKLSFESGTGDAPDDWYIVYSDKDDNLLKIGAYIVTAGKTKEEAEKDPHAIEYSDFQVIDEIPIATSWTFWGWTEKKGLTKKLGKGKIKNIKFLDLKDDFFLPPKNFKKVLN